LPVSVAPREMARGAVNVGGTIAIRATATGGESTMWSSCPAKVNGHVER
jgi:hypothetical protein